MTPRRFAALAEAYGGDIDRWPAAEREAARAHLLGQPDAQRLLSAQAGLDAALAGWSVPGPGAALAAGIASAVARRHVYAGRMRLWLSGVGAAAALASGIAAGISAVAVAVPAVDRATGQLYEISVLGAPLDVGTNAAGDGRL